MALVDYSSSSSAESVDDEPPRKCRKDRRNSDDGLNNDTSRGAGSTSDMPPLPSTFHDLYASTVRHSVVDDPSLHHGRKRLIPHVPGNWPSHLYIEWHPTAAQHGMLTKLLKEVEAELAGEVQLLNFLTSDLGSPLPLHISLSRPIVLSTGDKDAFLDKVTLAIQASAISPFAVTPRGLEWYKSPDSDRTFLILRVTAHNPSANETSAPNPELVSLLTRCNNVVSMFGQPPLYQQTSREPVGTAFHISIAWCFGLAGEETSLRALNVLTQRRFADVRTWEIDVAAVKVKIGNVVHHVALSGPGYNTDVDRKLFER